MQSLKRSALAVMLVVSLSLMGCATTTSTTVSNNICCSAFAIIQPSPDDTTETLRQIYEHNAVYEEMCLNKEGR